MSRYFHPDANEDNDSTERAAGNDTHGDAHGPTPAPTMSKLRYLLILVLVAAVCEGVFASEQGKGFVQPLDFGPIFDSSGISSLASNPIAAAVLKVDKSQYPQLFDTIVSSSIDSLQSRVAPSENRFSAEHFGFNPIASQSFLPPVKSARFVAQPRLQQAKEQLAQPLKYDIRTVHDADYKVYKPEENDQGEEILAALKNNPTVAAYFKPAVTNVEVAHPLKYRNEEANNENIEIEQNYNPNAYITGPARIRRYTSGRQRDNLRKSSDEEDDTYSYKPKAFDSDAYRSAYTEEKDPNKDYDYTPYSYDAGYDHKAYERIKELSEKQAAEIKQNPGNCKEVKKDGMTCMTCKDPKTGGNYESCSYVAEPKNNKYAYSKEKKFDSNDEPDEPEGKSRAEQPKLAKYKKESDSDEQKYAKTTSARDSGEKNDRDDSGDKYKAYYIHTAKPKPSEALRAAEENPDDETESVEKPYNYKKALPGFYTDNEPKKDVEHVLAEFKKKDRYTCKKVQKNGMTCFQCIDKSGLKNEECMYVSESAPQRSHLAYQEVKEFTSKPATLESEGAASSSVTTAPVPKRSAAYVVDNTSYGKKLKRKKTPQALAASATKPVASVAFPVIQGPVRKVKRSAESDAEAKATIKDQSNIAAEEFAGDSSKGAYWAETMPRYSAALGVTLPEFMLSRSEHEVSFDETVAGA